MTTRKFDVCYLQPGKTEKDKGYWKQIGVVLENEKGMFLKLEMLPIGWNGFASFFEPKPKEEKVLTKGAGPFDDMKDDTPF